MLKWLPRFVLDTHTLHSIYYQKPTMMLLNLLIKILLSNYIKNIEYCKTDIFIVLLRIRKGDLRAGRLRYKYWESDTNSYSPQHRIITNCF